MGRIGLDHSIEALSTVKGHRQIGDPTLLVDMPLDAVNGINNIVTGSSYVPEQEFGAPIDTSNGYADFNEDEAIVIPESFNSLMLHNQEWTAFADVLVKDMSNFYYTISKAGLSTSTSARVGAWQHSVNDGAWLYNETNVSTNTAITNVFRCIQLINTEISPGNFNCTIRINKSIIGTRTVQSGNNVNVRLGCRIQSDSDTIGSNSPVNLLNGHIKNFKIYNRAISDTDLDNYCDGIPIPPLYPGIHLEGTYLSNTTVTENGSFELRYYAIDEDFQRYPATGYAVYPTTLALGDNTVNMAVTPTTTTYNKTVHIYLADTFSIDTTGGTAIGAIPTIESTISGGAWSISAPTTQVYGYSTQTAIVEGVNTVTMQYKDANGDTYVSDNTIEVTYADTAPIVEIDGQSIAGDVETADYEVSVKYLYGGSLVYREGALVTYIGDVVWYGGVIVEVVDYALSAGVNSVQVTGLTDDFGQTFSTTVEECTKIPHIQYIGPTTFSKEEVGLVVEVVDGLLIDLGAPYQDTANTTFTFTDGVYGAYQLPATYAYPTGESNTIQVDIEYVEGSTQKWDNPANVVFDVFGVSDNSAWDDPDNVAFYTGDSAVVETEQDFRYYKAQFHHHTNNSDGADAPETIVDAYYNAGYEVLATTDHNYITDEPHFGMVTFPSAEETSVTLNHVQAIGITSQAPESYTAQEIIDYHAVNNPDALIMYNHSADGVNSFTETQLLNDTYDLLEIINARRGGNYEAEWDLALTGGQKVYGVASDDCHDISYAPGFNKGYNMLYMDGLTKPKVYEALSSGNFFATHNGHDVVVQDTATEIIAKSSSFSNFTFIGENGVVLKSENNVLTSAFDVTGYTDKYVRVVSKLSSDTTKIAFGQPRFFH